MAAQIIDITASNPDMTAAVTASLECSIYVASLADYSAGILHGRWIDCLANDSDEVQEQIALMLADSPTARQEGRRAEEWAIHDHGGWHGMRINETEDIEALCELAAELDEHGEALAVYLDHVGTRDVSGFQDAYCGTWSSEQDYAEDLADDIMEIPDHIAPYFDYERFARDLFMCDYFSERVEDGVAIFRHI